jgi:hypothetical protein
MPAEVMRTAPGDAGDALEPGDRAWHDGKTCRADAAPESGDR